MPEGQDKKTRTGDKSTGLTVSQGGLTGVLTNLTGTETGLSSVLSGLASSFKIKNETRPSFEELLAKYEQKGATQK